MRVKAETRERTWAVTRGPEQERGQESMRVSDGNSMQGVGVCVCMCVACNDDGTCEHTCAYEVQGQQRERAAVTLAAKWQW